MTINIKIMKVMLRRSHETKSYANVEFRTASAPCSLNMPYRATRSMVACH